MIQELQEVYVIILCNPNGLVWLCHFFSLIPSATSSINFLVSFILFNFSIFFSVIINSISSLYCAFLVSSFAILAFVNIPFSPVTKGTIEFRLFQFDAPTAERKNGLHAGQLKSYIQLCLALSQMAKTVKTASPKPQQNDNPKYAMRTWLLRLGFIGEEFATARDLLTRRLAGDAAFRNGRAA